ncbi:MAG: TetR family transcriptional regulator [Pseudomonadota bacterium]
MASNKREQLIQTASKLFYREGYHATGIDRILAESGVAKMTLYKYFKSKDELILAVLAWRREYFNERMAQSRERLQAREALLATFDGLHQVIERAGFNGCLFIHAAAEFHDRDHPVHCEAAASKAGVHAHFRVLLEALNAPKAEQLARQLQFLLEGALTMAHMQGPGQQARDAKVAAELLLNAAGI